MKVRLFVLWLGVLTSALPRQTDSDVLVATSVWNLGPFYQSWTRFPSIACAEEGTLCWAGRPLELNSPTFAPESNGRPIRSDCAAESASAPYSEHPVGTISNISRQPQTCNGNGTTTLAPKNVFAVDGVNYPFTAAGINACIVAAENSSANGICDARGVPSATFTEEIDVGTTSFPTSPTLLLPSNAVWKFNIKDAVSCGIKQFSGSSVIGMQTGGGPIAQLLPANSEVNMQALYCTDPSPKGRGSYVRAEGFDITNRVGAIMGRAAFVAQHLYDNSSFSNITDYCSRGTCAKIYDTCCGVEFRNLTVNGMSAANVQPLVIGDCALGGDVFSGGVMSTAFFNASVTHPGAGKNNILIQCGPNTSNDAFYNLYMEANSTDTTTPGIQIQADVFEIQFYNFQFLSTAPSSTAYAVDVALWPNSSAQTADAFFGGRSGTNNLVNDHQDSLQLRGNPLSRFQADHYVPIMDTVQAQSKVFSASLGASCASNNVTLAPGWGKGAATGNFSGYSQSCQFTITTGSPPFEASPAVTFGFPSAVFPVIPVCTLDVHNITGPGGAIIFNNSLQSATAPVFTAETSTGAAFKPAAGETYTVVLRCGP